MSALTALRERLHWILAVALAAAVGWEQGWYWSEAFRVRMGYLGCGWWSSGPPGSLFPWPKNSGHFAVFTRMDDPMDLFVCHLMEYRLFILASVSLILLAGALGWLLGKWLAKALDEGRVGEADEEDS